MLEQLYTIVNTRYEDGRAVVLTTNLDDDELNDQIGDRTVSRLTRCAAAAAAARRGPAQASASCPSRPRRHGRAAAHARTGLGRGSRRAARLRRPASH